jgi:hypothetical protein
VLKLVKRALDDVLWVSAFAQREQLVVEEEVVVVTQQQRQPSTRIRFSNML